MVAVNWDKPVIADPYDTGVLPVLNEKVEGAATMDFAGDTNVPVGAIRFNTVTGQFDRWSGTAWVEVVPLPTNHIGGLITSNDADADHDINITAGRCRDVGDTANMWLATEITKQIDAAWALGDDAGGIDAGAVAADTMYAVWLIKRSDTGVVDALISTSFTAPNMPADYDLKRLIGAVKTEAAADIVPFLQSGDYFRYMASDDAALFDVDDATIAHGVFETGTLSVPPQALAHIYGHQFNVTTTASPGYFCVKTKGDTQAFATDLSFSGFEAAGTFERTIGIGMVLVDSNSQIEYATNEIDGAATLRIHTLGFTMLSRREP